jgi:hypothetical protein
VIRQRLAVVGVRLVAIPHDPAVLPGPTEPPIATLQRVTWLDATTDPGYGLVGQLATKLQRQPLERYVPAAGLDQRQRWQTLSSSDLAGLIRSDRALLRLGAKEYLWFEGGVLFDLAWEAACLAMFALDRSNRAPLALGWNADQGWLDWGDIHLPPSYAYWFCYHSQAEGDRPGWRYVPRQERRRITESLQKLGVISNPAVAKPSQFGQSDLASHRSPYARSIPYQTDWAAT